MFHFPAIAFAEELRDIKPPVEPRSDLFWLLLLLVVIALAAAIYFVWQYFLRRKNLAAANQIVKLPHKIAYERLERLRQRNLPAQGHVKEYFIELSDIVRRYVEGRFSIDAPEMTTEEFLGSLRQSDQLSNVHKNLLKEFLNCSDMVKFAQYGPSVEEIDNGFISAKKFVDETRPVEILKDDI